MDDKSNIDWSELEKELAACSTEVLIHLVLTMLKTDPGLMATLDAALPHGLSHDEDGSYNALKSRAQGVMQSVGYEYHSLTRAAPRLLAIVRGAEALVEEGDYGSAVTTLAGVVDGILEEYWNREDPDFAVLGVVCRCVELVGTCVSNSPNLFVVGNQALPVLQRVYEFGKNCGQDAFGEVVAKVALFSLPAAPKREFADWLLRFANGLTGEHHKYERESARRLNLRLLEAERSDEEYLAFCRKYELQSEAFERLIQLGRPEEAMREAMDGGCTNTVFLANRLVTSGHWVLAEELVRKDIQHPSGHDARRWLREQYLERGKREAALELSMLDFRYQPSVRHYCNVEDLARSVNRWTMTRPVLLNRLQERGVRAGDKLEIYLHENMLPQAVELMGRPSARRQIPSQLLLQAAEATEADFPDQAIPLYREQTEVYPDNYETAAFCLSRMKAIYRRWGRTDDWEQYFRPLQEKHKRKRNFIKALREYNVID